jgi:hypothetical protein
MAVGPARGEISGVSVHSRSFPLMAGVAADYASAEVMLSSYFNGLGWKRGWERSPFSPAHDYALAALPSV